MAFTSGQPPDFGVTCVSRDDGLPGSQVHDVVVASDSVVWVATSAGLASYDGTTVQRFGRADGLSSHGLRAISIAGDGRMFIGTDAGVDVRSGESIRPAEATGQRWSWGLADRVVHHFDGRIFVATGSGLVMSTPGGGWERVDHPVLGRVAIADVAVSPDGAVWVIGPFFGLLRNNGDGWTQLEGGDDDFHRGRVIRSTSSADRVVLGLDSEVIEVDLGGRTLRRWAGEGIAPVTALLAQGSTLWAAVDNHLVELVETNGGWDRADTFLADTGVNEMVTDSLGNLWVATETMGLAKISVLRQSIRRIDVDAPGSVLSLRHAPNGQLLVGASNGAVSTGPSGTHQARELAGLAVWDHMVDGAGVTWAATSDGLYRTNAAPGGSGKFDRLTSQLTVLDVAARTFAERQDGMWVGTLAGLAAVKGTEQREVMDASGASLGYVYTLLETDKTLWIGTLGNGLWAEHDGALERVVGPGLTDTGNTYAIVELVGGDLIVTQDDRVVRRQPSGLTETVYQSEEPVAAWGAVERDGELWLGTSSGLVLLDLARRTVTRRVAPFLGLDGWEFTTSRSLSKSPQGELLCGTAAGMLSVDPVKLPDIAIRPDLSLRTAHWANADPARDGDSYVLPEGKWTVTAHTFSSWRYDENELEFRFHLLGFDPAWSDANRSGQVRYSSLPAGDYTLMGQCFSPLVGWGTQTKLLSISVIKSATIVDRMVATLTGSSRRVRRLKSQNLELEQRVRERTMALQKGAEQLEVLNAELAALAVTDALTGLHNRRFFDTALQNEWDRAVRTHTSIGLLLIDVDYFKPYNDEFGHQAGDECLTQIATLIATTTRSSTAVVARYGGEEFAVIAAQADPANLERIANRIHDAIRSAAIHHPHGNGRIITVSIGGKCALPSRQETTTTSLVSPGIDSLIADADSNLYQAKSLGRDRSLIT